MTATAIIRAGIEGELTGTVDIGIVSHVLSYAPALAFADGTGANQVGQIWADTRTLSASATEDLDLSGTALTNAIGQAVAFTKIRGLLIRAAAANTNNVIVGGAAANQWFTWAGASTHTVTVRPGGLMLLAAPDATGYAVTAGTADLLKIANSAGSTSVTYDIVLIGTI
jgi:hypothetical protein